MNRVTTLYGLNFKREVEMPFGYRNRQTGTRRVDFPVEEVIPVEPKALIQLEDVHPTQAINYLEAYNIEVGLLINSGSKSHQFKRLINQEETDDSPNGFLHCRCSSEKGCYP